MGNTQISRLVPNWSEIGFHIFFCIFRRTRALAKIAQAQKLETRPRPGLDFLALALQGKKINFGKVIKMPYLIVGSINVIIYDRECLHIYFHIYIYYLLLSIYIDREK